MPEPNDESGKSVTVSMELAGEYDDVMARLDTDPSAGHELAPLVDDVERVLETVERVGGGTRSTIAEALAGTTVEYDAEGVVPLLQVLERYGLVTLEGNTWYPGTRRE